MYNIRILEQIPGLCLSTDITPFINSKGYWPSYNTPYFSEIFNKSGYDEMVRKYGDIWSHDHCPRANIFRRNQSSVIDFESMKHIMRENDYLHDPLSKSNPANAISSRFDLEPSQPTLFGATDSKILSYQLFKNFTCMAVSGPTHQSLPPFSYTGQWKSVAHFGQPDIFNFDYVLIDI